MRSSIPIRALLLFFLLATVRIAHARETEDFVIYEANNHSAEELKKAAASLLNGGRVSTMGAKVVIYGTKSQRNKVLKLFGELDHPLRNYVVRVRVAGRGNNARSASAVEAGVNARNVILKKKSGVLTGRGTGTVGVGTEAGEVTGSAESSSEDASSSDGGTVVVSDGGSARLYAGTSVFPKTVSVHLRSIGKSGAHVEIREANASATDVQGLITEIDVVLGQWRTIGGTSVSDRSGRRELLGSGKRSSLSEKDIQIRVDAEADEGSAPSI